MSDERRDERLDRILAEETRAEYGSEEVPREEMWRAIAAARTRGRGRIARRIGWAAGLAAAVVAALLVIGREPQPIRSPERTESVATPAVDPDDLLLRSHFARTGRLLAEAADSIPGDAAHEARPLLAATRVLLDAPERDPATDRLLEDTEVALALIVRSGVSPAAVEREVLRASLSGARIAERLRAAAGGDGG